MRIYGNYDVVIVGGGASGCCAAIAAAREGANTLVIEQLGAVGGMMNISGPPGWAFSHLYNESGERIIAGIVEELYQDLYKDGLAFHPPLDQYKQLHVQTNVDVDWCGLLLFEKMREAGVHFLLHTMAVDVLKEGNCVKGVVVENCEGRMAVMGKIIIEASVEGEICKKAGVEYQQIDRTKEELDPPSITFHMDGIDWDKAWQYYKDNPDEWVPAWIKGMPGWENSRVAKNRIEALEKYDNLIDCVMDGVTDNIDYQALTLEAIKNGDMHPYGDLGHFFTPRQFGHVQAAFQHTAQIKDCDTTNITEWSAGEVEARRQVVISIKAIQKYLPGYEHAYLTRITTTMRTREGRHTVGDYQMVATDVSSCAKFPDVMAKCGMSATAGGPFHSAATPGTAYNVTEGKVGYVPADGGSYDIPYRAFVPKGIEGMLMTGKLVSCTPDFKRDLLPDNMIWGQAAGTAAAVCVRTGKTPRELEADVSEVQDILRRNGAILEGTK